MIAGYRAPLGADRSARNQAPWPRESVICWLQMGAAGMMWRSMTIFKLWMHRRLKESHWVVAKGISRPAQVKAMAFTPSDRLIVCWWRKRLMSVITRKVEHQVWQLQTTHYWQKLWKCKVPPKIRVFQWHVAHDFLPNRANLHRKHVEPMVTCGFSGMEDR